MFPFLFISAAFAFEFAFALNERPRERLQVKRRCDLFPLCAWIMYVGVG